MALILDLEAYRIDRAAEFIDPVVSRTILADLRLTDPIKIAAELEKKKAAEIERVKRETQQRLDACALDPYTARIIALGWAWEGERIEHVRLARTPRPASHTRVTPRIVRGPGEAQEAELLREFWSMVYDARTGHVMPLIGFNSRSYDLPLLMTRSLLLGVPYPKLNIDRYRSPHPDVMLELCHNDPRKAHKLTWYARRFGLPTEDGFSGAEIAQLVESDNWDAIESHCRWDVRTCKALAERIGLIKGKA